MKFAAFLISSCCLAALMPAVQAQETFNFNSITASQLPPNDGSYPFAVFGNSGAVTYAPATLSPDIVSSGTPSVPVTLSVSGSPTPAESFQYQNLGGTFSRANGTPYLANVDSNPSTVLTFTFAQPITSIALDFEVNNILNFTTSDSSLSLNGVTATGMLDPNSNNFEDRLTFVGAPFTVATLSFIAGPNVGDFGYAIDNITVSPAGTSVVPEPGIVALGAAGLVTMAGLLRRRKK